MKHIIQILGLAVLCLVVLWCFCSIFAGRAERKAQELRRRNRQEQEEEELQIQVSLYNRQEEQQRKLMTILQRKFSEKMRKSKKDGSVLEIPTFVVERLQVDMMKREELEAEYAKITPEMIEQLDEDAKHDIRIAQENIAQLEEKLELYQLERAYKRWF